MLLFDKKQIIITTSVIIVLAVGFGAYYLFNDKFLGKIALLEQETQLLTEQFNNKLSKATKQLNAVKEDNKELQIQKQALEQKLKELNLLKEEAEYKIIALSNKHLELEQINNNLIKEKNKIDALYKESQAQAKNHKDTSYSLFQAGKLEVELSSIEQQLSEQYDNIAQKKNNLNYLSGKDYKNNLENITALEQQIEHLKTKREDLKQRINAYLAVVN